MANEFKIRKGLIVEGASGGTVVDVQGSQGQLFSVTDDLSGSIFAVSDISGVPIFDVNSSGISYFDGKVGIGTNSPLELLHLESTEPLIRLDDTNSGLHYIFGQDGDGFKFTTNNLTYGKYTFDANVGIGTTSPSAKLDVQQATAGNIISAEFDNIDYTANNRNAIKIRQQVSLSGSYSAYLGSDKNTGNVFLSNDSITANHLVIDTSGNVGIGATNPDEKLHVFGGAAAIEIDSTTNEASLKYNNSTTTAAIKLANNDLKTELGGSEKMRILANGNVGIGTTSPSARLHVENGGGSTTSPNTALIVQANTSSTISTGGGTAIEFKGVSSGGNIQNYQQARIRSVGQASNNGHGFAIDVKPSASSALTERLSLNSGGTLTLSSYGEGILKTNSSGTVGLASSGDLPGGPYLPLAGGLMNSNATVNMNSGQFTSVDFIDFGIGQLNGESTSNFILKSLGDITYNVDSNNNGNSSHIFQESGSELMRIRYDGNVGIGTTSPDTRLEVRTDSGAAVSNSKLRITAGAQGAYGGTAHFEGAYNDYGNVDHPNIVGKIEMASEVITPTNVGGTMKFFTKAAGGTYATAPIERMRIDSSGNVGIGTTSPGSELDVDGSIRLSKTGKLHGRTYPYTTNIGAGANATTTNITAGSTDKSEISLIGGDVGDRIEFKTNSTERMRIDSSGNVGIGTITPNAKLHIDSTTAFSLTDGSADTLLLTNDSNTSAIGAIGPSIGFGNMNSDRRTSAIATIRTGEDHDNMGLAFFTHPSDSNNDTIVQKMTIAHNGNVGIGTSTPNAKLDVQGTQGQLFSVTDDLSGDIFSVADISGIPIMNVNSDGTSYFDGDVGIGTTTPGYRLEVDGGIGDGVKIKAGNAASKDSLLVSTNNDVSKFLVQGDGKVIINSSAGIPTRNENFQVFGEQIITNTGLDGPVLYLGYNSSGSNTIQLGRGRTADGLSYMDFNGEVMSAGQYGFRIIRYGGQNASTELSQVGTGAFKVTCSNSADIILNPNSGNVGISQTNPSYKLDVTGNGRFTSTVTATNFILSSDERLKENVEKVCNNRVKADWKTFELKTEKGQKRYGVIAQELEKTNPEFVREDSQGFKSVAYIDLLIAKIAELEARLEKLEK